MFQIGKVYIDHIDLNTMISVITLFLTSIMISSPFVFLSHGKLLFYYF